MNRYQLNNGCIPPNPIGGNMVGIANQGYNTQPFQGGGYQQQQGNMGYPQQGLGYPQQGNMGGYYNNNYNNYYNPYMVQRQREMQEAQMREQLRSQSNIYKKLSRCAHTALDIEINEEELSRRWEPQQIRTQMTEEEIEDQNAYRLIQLCCNEQSYQMHPNNAFIQANNRITEQYKEKYPDDMKLSQYMSKDNNLYIEVVDYNQQQARRNMGSLYKSSDYRNLIKQNSNGMSYFNNVFAGNRGVQHISTDDMEVSLPSHLQSTFDERRQKFIESIMKNK